MKRAYHNTFVLGQDFPNRTTYRKLVVSFSSFSTIFIQLQLYSPKLTTD